MKKSPLVCLFLAGSLLAFAQNSGRGFSYQAVARNTDGTVKAKENIEIRFSLLPGNMSAIPDWQETQVATTDEFGVFTMTIGKGIKTGGSAAEFTDVNFAVAEFWLKVEIRDNGAWQEISTTQLLSVPYAEVAGNASPAPTGSIMPFAGAKDKIPTGWRLCDGSQLSRTEHAALYSVIGTNWGAGDGATTFHIPDLRGMFLRGVSYDSPNNTDDNRNNRPASNPGGNTNNEVGSVQGDEMSSHNHSGFTAMGGAHSHNVTQGGNQLRWESSSLASTDDGWSSTVVDAADNINPGSNLTTTSHSGHTHGIPTSGGSETRPDNAYVNYIIKL